MNEYFYNLAERAAAVAAERGLTVDPRWLYSQWAHETAEFASTLCTDYNNFGGITTNNPNEIELELGQPDGSFWYKVFDTPEAYADYFGKYITLYAENGIYNATTMIEYITCLKNGGYFGDTLENYIAGCEHAYENAFNAHETA